jgi:hypothetical protein
MKVHHFDSYNNGSDAPALRWLADRRQKGPKFVLTDGCFWGDTNYSSEQYCTSVCEPIMKAGRILRVPTLADMILIANHRPAKISDGSAQMPYTTRRANNR